MRTIDEFVARSDAKESSKTQYRIELATMETILGKPLVDASQRDVIRLAMELRKRTAGYQYAKVGRMFYRRAKRDDLRELLVLRQRTKKIRPADLLTPKEVQMMIDVAEMMRDKILVALLWECGVRVSELLAVTLGDVKVRTSPTNGGRKIYVLWFGVVKETGEEHEGYVIESAPLMEKWLKAYPFAKSANAPLIPSYRGNRLRARDSLVIVKGLARKAGIPKRVYNHLFRHSRATWALASGMTEAQVKVLYGWAPGSTMLSRYNHLTSKQAYGGLLKAEGLEAEKVDVERLRFDDEDLKPAVPTLVPPKGAKPATSSMPNVSREIDYSRLAKAMIEGQREELKAQYGLEALPLPSWSAEVRKIGELEKQIQELRAQLETKGAKAP